MRTNELRRAVIEKLEVLKPKYGIKEIYFERANDGALFPHLVVTFSGDNISDFYRKDYTVDVDVYTKKQADAIDIGDDIEDIFCNLNSPNDDILPTFFMQAKIFLDDSDKTIVHEVLRMQCQLYDNE